MSESTSGVPPMVWSAVSSPETRQRLATDGFAVVQLLTPDELDAVAAAHERLARASDEGLTIDYMRVDRTIMARVRTEVLPLVTGPLDAVFDRPRVIMATFVTKHPGPASEMFLHEDRVFVDERRHRAITAWIPLVPTGSATGNGALQVVPASHRLPTGPSGSNTADAIRPFEADLRRRLVTLDVPAGSAVVYDTRLVHASTPNLTSQARTAFVCVVIPADAVPVHVVAAPDGTLRLHEVDESFYVDLHPRQVEREVPDRYPCIETLEAAAPLTSTAVDRVLARLHSPRGG